MSLYQIRPLGFRQHLVAFELLRGLAGPQGVVRDIREEFTLWDPHGRPHKAYPEIPIERAMTGRELMEVQQAAWARHVEATRRHFGSPPLAGIFRTDLPLRGILAFPVEFVSERGRWTLAHHAGPRWYFTPGQIREGLPRPLPPAR